MKIRSSLACAAVVALTAHAFADNMSPKGKITSMQRQTPDSGLYMVYHVQIALDENGDGNTDSIYYSGGSKCADIAVLTTADREALQQAGQNGLEVSFDYRLVSSSAYGTSARCITAYRIFF